MLAANLLKVDKDRPSSWKPYNVDFCTSCQANCCAMPVEIKGSDLVRLNLVTQDDLTNSIKKVAKKLKKQGVISSYREGTDFFMITQKPNGDCYYLDPKTRFCTVYDIRPDTCRDFPASIGTRVGFCPAQKK